MIQSASPAPRGNGIPFLVGGLFLAAGSVVLLIGLLIDIVLIAKAL